jgi:hypothetical protein
MKVAKGRARIENVLPNENAPQNENAQENAQKH